MADDKKSLNVRFFEGIKGVIDWALVRFIGIGVALLILVAVVSQPVGLVIMMVVLAAVMVACVWHIRRERRARQNAAQANRLDVYIHHVNDN